MAEILHFPNNKERILMVAERLGFEALATVTERYGDGYVDGMIGKEADLTYHNMQHTMDVRDDARSVARAIGLDSYAQELVCLAASGHDLVQQKARGQMERESAAAIAGPMNRLGFAAEDIRAVSTAILGTEPILDDKGSFVGQIAGHQEYAAERDRLIALCVACGDMAGLYKSHGPLLALDLYKEANGAGTGKTPSLDGFMAFQGKQLGLLTDYRFPLPAGEALFGRLREAVVAYQFAVTQSYRSGVITGWQQLIDSAERFDAAYRNT